MLAIVYAYISENTHSSSGGYNSIRHFGFTIIFIKFPFLKGHIRSISDQLLQINEIINIFLICIKLVGKIVGSIPIMMVIYPIFKCDVIANYLLYLS